MPDVDRRTLSPYHLPQQRRGGARRRGAGAWIRFRTATEAILIVREIHSVRPASASPPKSVTAMKIKNSLKSLLTRHRENRLVRRRGRMYIINKKAPRFKARQG